MANQALAKNWSPGEFMTSNRGQEMISVNCAAIPENLIESELFGHEKGAFTGATATRTVRSRKRRHLFLDEIGELLLKPARLPSFAGKRNSQGRFGTFKKG